ncbi:MULTISPECIES: winged helix-turn-helix transcriptional regulator [Streptomyces]|uniref:Helix-turn-helix transcriptional regulator n=1 Tax=Streptomyces spinosisporus TaxID=2927582 RepID=A0ABS9Y019_9ACTN|nr:MULTISPECIES: helix-turn-helix domain-containing protein [Streptomyces]MCI3246462.1 helix-turn-helix transcriptional regulator [Streptomyces spinosisporus]WUB41306.1 helix-turn-helix transcriptional regulator [Streptomyces sp. NBC_00588]
MTQATEHAPDDDAVITRSGAFADRDAWTAQGWCSIERALEVMGTRSTMILLREVYYGANRYEDLARRTGLSEAVTAARLKQMVADGLLTRRPYREPGARTRSEYVLAPRGRQLFPLVVALMEWGGSLDGPRGGVELAHADCGGRLGAAVRCEQGHDVSLAETEARIVRREPHRGAAKE